MCHDRRAFRAYERETIFEATEEENEESLPEFLNEEADEDIEVVTDGGDETAEE